jgi:hypothetical protein
VSIYNRCWHFCGCSCHPLSIAAACCHRCELKLNLHLRCYHYETVQCSGWKPRVNLQSFVGYRENFRTRGVVMCKSLDVGIVHDPGCVFNCSWYVYQGRKREHRCRGEKGIFILEFLWFDSYSAFSWLMNTKRPSLRLA